MTLRSFEASNFTDGRAAMAAIRKRRDTRGCKTGLPRRMGSEAKDDAIRLLSGG
jgi:hypothetical protein